MNRAIADITQTGLDQSKPTEFRINIQYTLFDESWDPEVREATSENISVFVPLAARPKDVDEAVEDGVVAHILEHSSVVVDKKNLLYCSKFQRG